MGETIGFFKYTDSKGKERAGRVMKEEKALPGKTDQAPMREPEESKPIVVKHEGGQVEVYPPEGKRFE